MGSELMSVVIGEISHSSVRFPVFEAVPFSSPWHSHSPQNLPCWLASPVAWPTSPLLRAAGPRFSQWAEGRGEAILRSTMLTTTMVGLVLIIPFSLIPLLHDDLAIF
ncbi:hypothetical protein Mapa_007230 [Marchantia paleacea]|nr:hypothetical protein Mapa_007230 [Marchantia paleacea]